MCIALNVQVIDELEKAEIIFHFLLDKPEDMEVTKKPSAERGYNCVCTISSTTIPIESPLADDNGAYV